MRSIFIIAGNMLLLSVFLFKISVAQFQTYEITINTEGRSGFSDSKEDFDGNIILCGGERNLPYFTQIFGHVVKINSWGDALFRTFNFGSDTMSYFGQVIIAPDSNYLLFGAIGKEDSIYQFKDAKNIWVLKLDQNLNTIWDKRYEVAGDYWNPGYRVWLSNETIYAAGNVDWWDGYHRVNFFMAKFNLDGDTLKTNFPFIDDPMQFPLGGVEGGVMGSSNGEEGIIVLGDGGFQPSVEHVIVEVDSNLNYSFTPLSYPGNLSFQTPSIKRLTDVSYLWASNVHITYQGNADIVVAKVNDNHQFIDNTIFGRSDTADFPAFFKSIDFFDANNIYVASRNNYFSSDPINLKISVTFLDSSLNLKGWKWFGGDKNYSTYTVTATSDGGCVIGGTVCDWQNSPSGDVDLWIKKVFPNDIITNAEETPDPFDSDVAIFPNPGRDYFWVKTIRKNLIIKIFTSSGSPVLKDNITEFPSQKVNTSGLKNGANTYQIIDMNKKIIIESGTWIKN